jgi:hypothetical protein
MSHSKILWGKGPSNDPNSTWLDSVVRDRNNDWLQQLVVQCPDGSVVTVKAGNKPYGLTAKTTSEYNPERVIPTETGLMQKYR